MRIEDKWDDGFLYFVDFQVLQGNISKGIRKSLVIPEELTKPEVEKLIKHNFKSVVNINSIDYYDEVLSLKSLNI